MALYRCTECSKVYETKKDVVGVARQVDMRSPCCVARLQRRDYGGHELASLRNRGRLADWDKENERRLAKVASKPALSVVPDTTKEQTMAAEPKRPSVSADQIAEALLLAIPTESIIDMIGPAKLLVNLSNDQLLAELKRRLEGV